MKTSLNLAKSGVFVKKIGVAILGSVLFFGCGSDDKKDKNVLNLEINGTKKEKKAANTAQNSMPKTEIKLNENLQNSAPNSQNLQEQILQKQNSQNLSDSRIKQQQNQMQIPQNKANLDNEDINKTIDEIAKNAKILGENFEKFGKDSLGLLNNFLQNNKENFDNLKQNGENLAKDLNKTFEIFGQNLENLAKEADKSFGKFFEDLNATLKENIDNGEFEKAFGEILKNLDKSFQMHFKDMNSTKKNDKPNIEIEVLPENPIRI